MGGLATSSGLVGLFPAASQIRYARRFPPANGDFIMASLPGFGAEAERRTFRPLRTRDGLHRAALRSKISPVCSLELEGLAVQVTGQHAVALRRT